MEFDSVGLIPLLSKEDFQTEIPFQTDWFKMDFPKISFNQIDWGFPEGKFNFSIESVNVSNADITVYRDKRTRPLDTRFKPLFTGSMRNLPFEMHLDTLTIFDSRIVYVEHPDNENPAGEITFDRLYASAYKFSNDKDYLGPNPVSIIDARTHLIGEVLLEANVRFNPLDETDAFVVKGHLDTLNMRSLNPVLENLAGVKSKGTAYAMDFEIYGNDTSATGVVNFQYENFHLDIFKEKKEIIFSDYSWQCFFEK